MSSHTAPSPPGGAAAPAAASGGKPMRKRQEVLHTLSVGVQTEEIVEERDQHLQMKKKIEMVNDYLC